MAVAEKTIVERAPRNPQRELALSSLLGGLYVLFSLGLIFAALPAIWAELFANVNEFLSDALLLIVEGAAIVGLLLLGLRLERNASPPRGFRAGTFTVCAAAFVIVWLAHWIGALLSNSGIGPAGAVVPLGIAAALVFVMVRLFLSPGFSAWLLSLEDQGWFHAVPYKANQGVRVRRGTMLALLVLGGCGIWVMVQHRVFGSDLGTGNNWEITVPFTADEMTDTEYVATLMHQLQYTGPLVFCAALLWLAWRVVNWPLFADFLIATEAEMNKVSWTSRKRLFQDTIVVLVTVTLLTIFLFVVDIMWIQILRGLDVLRVDLRSEQLKQQESAKW